MNFLSQKETIQKELSILQQKAANRIDFYEEDILVTHWNLRDAVKNPRSEDELNVLYGNFIDSIEVKQSYVTIALNILTILGYRRNIYFIARKKPPFDFGQMVVWNSGAEGNR